MNHLDASRDITSLNFSELPPMQPSAVIQIQIEKPSCATTMYLQIAATTHQNTSRNRGHDIPLPVDSPSAVVLKLLASHQTMGMAGQVTRRSSILAVREAGEMEPAPQSTATKLLRSLHTYGRYVCFFLLFFRNSPVDFMPSTQCLLPCDPACQG